MQRAKFFIFAPLRSGSLNYMWDVCALKADGRKDSNIVKYWFSVRPAHELTC